MVSYGEAQAQLSYEISVYREQMNMLKKETERVSLTALDLTNALKSVEGLGVSKVLIPIGGGAMLHGSLAGQNVIVPIGGGYLLEMKKDVAILELQKRITATNSAVEKLTAEFNRLNEKLRSLSSQMAQLSSDQKIDSSVNENSKEDYL